MSGLLLRHQHGPGARQVGIGFWVRLALAATSAALLVVTIAWPDWIELVFRLDPDHGSGWLEWAIVVVAFALTVTFSMGARHQWRRFATTTAADSTS
jgi:hypothetical protein